MKQRVIAYYRKKQIVFPWTAHSIMHLIFQDYPGFNQVEVDQDFHYAHLIFQDYPGFNQVEVDQDFHYAHWSFIHWSCDEGL